MKKPDILYHASENNDLIQLNPHTDEERLSHYGKLLFATPYRSLAAMFLAPKTQDVQIMRFNDRFVFIVASSPEKFQQKDLGGTIYVLPSEKFSTHKDLNMPDTEYVTSDSVEPIGKYVYKSAIEAMKANDIQIYFADESTLSAIRAADDHGLEILESLTLYSYV